MRFRTRQAMFEAAEGSEGSELYVYMYVCVYVCIYIYIYIYIYMFGLAQRGVQ